uniref:Kynurenine formamidase n=1 Tax=Nilaparvata lugens TaxID=108931 RepID=A0A190EFG9_NILLU|nr:kynurenine formamidase [Nilaparvata lugens]
MDSEDDTENQYQPSRWSKRCPPDEAVPLHVKIATNESNVARTTVPFKSNLRYGTREGQTFDIYGNGTLKKDSPMFVYIHGGYWQYLTKELSAYCVVPLHEAGVRVVVPDYDLAPNVSLSIIVQEVFELATFIMKMAKEDGVRDVWFGGHSAGAHLSSMLLSTELLSKLDDDSKAIFRGLFLISGVYNLKPLLRTTVNDALNLTEKELSKLSPMSSIDDQVKNHLNKSFNLVVAVGENDSPAFQQQSRDFHEVLSRRGIASKYIFVEEVDHFEIVENLSKVDYKLTKELIQLITK